MGYSNSSTEREVYSNKYLHQKNRKISNELMHLEELEKQEQTKASLKNEKLVFCKDKQY